MFPLLPTQLTTANLTIVNLTKLATKQNPFTTRLLKYELDVYYGEVWSVGPLPMVCYFIFIYRNSVFYIKTNN